MSAPRRRPSGLAPNDTDPELSRLRDETARWKSEKRNLRRRLRTRELMTKAEARALVLRRMRDGETMVAAAIAARGGGEVLVTAGARAVAAANAALLAQMRALGVDIEDDEGNAGR